MIFNKFFTRIAVAILIILLTFAIYIFSTEAATKATEAKERAAASKMIPTAYTHCPTLHTQFSMDGLNIFKEKLVGYMSEVYCVPMGTMVLLPPLMSHGYLLDGTDGQQKLISFDHVFDMDLLNEFFKDRGLVLGVDAFWKIPEHEKFNTDASIDTQLSMLNDQVEYEYVSRTGNNLQCKAREIVHNSTICTSNVAQRRDTGALESFIKIAGLEKFFKLLGALSPNKRIRQIGEKFLKAEIPGMNSDAIVEPLMCIHLRTEADWKLFQKIPPKFYSNEMYASKIKQHMKDAPHLYKPVKLVYISGAHSDEYFSETVIPIFQEIFGSHVKIAGHQHLVPFGYKEMLNIQKAALDQHICSKAKLFVGNRNSGWSEMTTYLHASYHKPGVKLDEMSWFQVNDNSDDDIQQNAKMNVMHPPNEHIIF